MTKIPTIIPILVRCSLPYLLAMGISSSKQIKTMIPATSAIEAANTKVFKKGKRTRIASIAPIGAVILVHPNGFH